VDASGRTRHTQASYVPDVVAGEVRGFFVLVTDVTPRVEAQRAMDEALAKTDGLTMKDTLPIVVRAVVSAMKRDAASGDSFDVAVISTKGYKELTEEEKKSIAEAKP
jgi:hypothetical protein